jgi:glycine oxidase
VGLSVAYELAARGARVRVVDPRGAGQGATRASAGMLAPYSEGHVNALLELGLRSLASYPEFVARIEADSGERVELEQDGTLHVALNHEEAEQLAATAQLLEAAKADCELMDGAGARRVEPQISERVAAALLIRNHGYVAPAPLAAAIARAAASRGVALSSVRAIGLQEAGGRLTVQTTDAAIPADAVVIAAGSWSSQLQAGSAWVKPIRGQLVQLRAARRAAGRIVWGPGCYVVPWRDGSVLVGATAEDVGYDESATVGGVRRLLDAAVDLLPELEAARFEDVRVGLRPMTRDELPVIGRSSTIPNLFYAAGHYRNGILLAPLTAQFIADLLIDGREDPDLALVRPGRLDL